MDAKSPLPSEQAASRLTPHSVEWYVWGFWHVVYLSTLAFMLVSILWPARTALGWHEVTLTLLVLAQTALYLKILLFNKHWPLSARQLALYFGGSLALWFVEWRLEPGFFWVVMSYFGQMYGLLPPRVAIPGTVFIFFLYYAETQNWDLARASVGPAIGFFIEWLGSAVVFLFLYYSIRIGEERGQLIVQLQAAQKELEAARQRDAELAALRERERLARDLHDSLGHALVALSVQLEAVQRLYKVDPERASAQVDELKALTRASMDDLRRSLAGLRTPGLGERCLSDALQTLSADTSQRAHLAMTCHVAEGANQLTPALAETLWRVAQEAVANVERHAAARRVELRLELETHTALLSIQDDGRGLPLHAEQQPGHYGLRGMRERVEGLGGALTFASNGQGGTHIEARLPIL